MTGSSSGIDASPETPENSPTESTKVWMMKKFSGFFQWLFGVPEPLCVPVIPQPTSETDLVDTEQSSVPVSEQDPQVDLVDPEESSVPGGLTRSEPEPVSSEGQAVEVRDAISDLKSPTLVCDDLSDSAGPSGSSSGIDQGGMDASPETPEKISSKALDTNLAMSTNLREVCLEVYVNGEFYSGESCWVPEEEDAQLEFAITDAIYDHFGSSAVISAQLEVDLPEDMSVSYSLLEGDAVQADLDMINSTSACVERDEQLENEVKSVISVLVSPTEVGGSSSGIDASPETPENSPTESTKVWMMKKFSGFFQWLFGVPEPLCVPVIPQPTSETDLVDTEQSSVPVPRVSEQDPQVDLVDPEESSVPGGLTRSEPEPVSSEGQAVEVRDAISDLKSPTLVCDDLSDSAGPSGSSSGIDQGGMDASPETPEKISSKALDTNLAMSTNLREVCLEVYVNGEFYSGESCWVPEEEDVQLEFAITDAIYDHFGSSAVISAQLEVDLPEDMSVSYSLLEGDAVQADLDMINSTSACVERDEQLENEVKSVISVLVSPTEVGGSSSGIDASPETPENSPTESTKVWMMKKFSGFFQWLFGVPEPLCVPVIPQPTSETDLVDTEQSSVPVSEQDPQVDLVDPEESSVPGGLTRSEPEPVSSEGQAVEVRDAISDLKSPTLVCDDLSDSAGPSGSSSGIDQGGMDASPETPEKISSKALDTNLAMSTNLREVCLEVYVNGEFYSGESCWVPEEEDAQLEFTVTDAIYDHFGSSAVISAQLEVDLPEDMSVSYSLLEGDAVQADLDMIDSTSACVERDEQLENEVKSVISVLVSPTEVAGSSSGIDASPETPENSPTESTKVWMMKKFSGFFQWLFGVPEPLCVPVIPQPTSETDLVDTEQSSVPVSEQDPQVDLVDPEESSVPGGLTRSEPEPVSSEGQAVEVRDAISDLKSPTLVCDDLSDSAGPSGSSSGIDQGGMDASPETPEKISSKALDTNLAMSTNLREVCLEVYVNGEFYSGESCWVPEEEDAQLEFTVTDAIYDHFGSSAVISAQLEVDLPEDMSVSYSLLEGDAVQADLDMIDSTSACVERDEQLENEVKSVISVLVSPTEVAGSSSGIDEPELDLVDPKESCVPGPTVPELEPELDLVDLDESCVPGPSVPYACTSEQELVQEETCYPLEERVKGCIQHRKPVTAVWDNIFIGNEEIARDRMKMKELGITHILNAAAVKKLRFPWEKDPSETVNTGTRYYRGMNITYCGLPTTHSCKISKYFVSAAKFIHKAKKNPKNKVFIHCTEGVNYAPTLFLAYLMIYHYMTLEDAIEHLEVRCIKPDIDFLKQLEILNEELEHKNNSWKKSAAE